jgi:putative phosphoesterase
VRVAALYDVHGNLPALEAVLEQVPDDAAIVLGGDLVAGPFPVETFERLQGLGGRAHWLRGNADRELAPDEAGSLPDTSRDWLRGRLSREQIAFLHELPPALTLEVDGLGSVLFCHAVPGNDLDIFTDRTPEERLRPLFAGVDADLVVCGHTHIQFERAVAGVRVVNAGSVGMAYEDEPGAYWTLLGPGVEYRHAAFELDTGEYPAEWPSGTREEALAFFESRAVGS